MPFIDPIEIHQGSAYRHRWVFYATNEQGNQQLLNLRGARARLQIRRTLKSRPLIDIDTAVNDGRFVLNETDSSLQCVLSADDTDVLDTSCVYGIMVTYSNGDPREEVVGPVRVNPRIVR